MHSHLPSYASGRPTAMVCTPSFGARREYAAIVGERNAPGGLVEPARGGEGTGEQRRVQANEPGLTAVGTDSFNTHVCHQVLSCAILGARTSGRKRLVRDGS